MVFKMALKNILGNKRRAMLTFLIMSFGIAMYILMGGILKGFDKTSFENVINFETGHLKIQKADYDEDDLGINNFITNYQSVLKELSQKKFITGLTERLKYKGQIDNGVDSYPALAIGIDNSSVNSVFNIKDFISKGNISDGGIVVGENLARDLNLKIGDSVYFTFRTANDMLDSVEVPISGIINAPDPQTNNSTLFFSLNFLQKLLGEDAITEINIKTSNLKKLSEYIIMIRPLIRKDLELLTWQEMAKDIFAITKAKHAGQNIFILAIIIIALIGIVNTMLMSVLEKSKEIGTLKAIGMTDVEVEKMFIVEGFIIGVLGSILGIILGVLFTWHFITKGIDITAFTNDSDMNVGYRVMGTVKAAWDIKTFIISITMTPIVSAISAYIPARLTKKMQPAKILRTT